MRNNKLESQHAGKSFCRKELSLSNSHSHHVIDKAQITWKRSEMNWPHIKATLLLSLDVKNEDSHMREQKQKRNVGDQKSWAT